MGVQRRRVASDSPSEFGFQSLPGEEPLQDQGASQTEHGIKMVAGRDSDELIKPGDLRFPGR